MTVYLLDTNHCSRLIVGDETLTRRVEQAGEEAIATCVIVYGELLDMAYRSERAEANLPQFRAFLENMALYLIDETVADTYAQLKAALFARFGPTEKAKRRRFTLAQIGIGENDLWIAAVAVRHNLVVVSADTDFTRLQEAHPFALENWIKS